MIAALNEAEVEFVVIGGFAVSAHGYPRGTKDLDIVPDPAPENLERLAGLLDQLEAELLGVEELTESEVIRPDLDGLMQGGNFVLGTSLGRLDIMQYVVPELEYHDLEAGSFVEVVFGNPVRFCGFEQLIAMKEAAGRTEDLLDIERLREARTPSPNDGDPETDG